MAAIGTSDDDAYKACICVECQSMYARAEHFGACSCAWDNQHSAVHANSYSRGMQSVVCKV